MTDEERVTLQGAVSILNEVIAEAKRSVVVVEKSRRTGYSWTAAAIAALHASRSREAGGMDVLYMGYEKEMTREFVDYVADWAAAFNLAAGEVEEFVWNDPDHPEHDIGAFRVRFASGFEVVALPSVARAFRGKQGLAILDEVAFMDDFTGCWKAALAYLMWGGKVLALSTHLGEDNPFNALVQDIRAGKTKYTLQRCTFDEAMAEGLFRRICLRTGEEWTPEGEAAFRADTLAKYRDNADEELHCIPSSGGGIPIPSSIVRARTSADVPVLRWKQERNWALLPEVVREAECRAWIKEVLQPHLDRLKPDRPYAVGQDFALVQDLSVIWPLCIERDTSLRTPFVIELRTIPYEQQKMILWAVMGVIRRKRALALDANGNGLVLAMAAASQFGAIVHQVNLTEPWYREHMPKMKSAFDEGLITVPRDEDTIGDFPMLRMVRGVIRVPASRIKAGDGARHGDAAIACALSVFGAHQEAEEYGYEAVSRTRSAAAAPMDDDDDLPRPRRELRGRCDAMSILDQFGRSIPASEIRRLREEVAAPTLAGVRPVWSGHPAEGLTPRRLAAIHRAAAQGDALRYLELAEDIEERDLHYASVIGTRKRAVSQLPITVEAASDDAEHVRHADFLREWLGTGALEEALPDALDAIGKGFSVLEIMWETEPRMIRPAKLVYRPQRWFDVAQQDGDTIMLREGATLEPLAPHKFWVHRHPSKSGLIMRSGLARVASWAWMFKSFNLRDWAIFVQNYGQPLRLGRYGPESSDEDRRVLWQAVANIAGDCAAIVPKGMEIDFIEVKNAADGSALYEKRADWLDRQISKLVLGQTTTTDAVSGGHAVAKEHRLVQEDIERADAKLLSVSVTRHLAHAIIAFNFGPQAKYPVIRIGRPDEIPLAELVTAIEKLGPQGLVVEASQVRDRLGLAEPAEGVEVIGGRPPPPPPLSPEPPQRPELQAFRRRIASLHASQPEADVMQALTDRLALDAQGALGGALDRIQAELHAATDLADFGRRLAALDLDPTALAEVLGRGMAIAHLAGQAAVLDELQGG